MSDAVRELGQQRLALKLVQHSCAWATISPVAVTGTHATLRIQHGSRPAAAVTAMLKLEPTRSFEIGSRTGPRTPAPRRHSHWALRDPLPEDGNALDTHLAWLLDQIEPRRDALMKLVDLGYEPSWWCFIAQGGSGQGGVVIEPALLARLSAIPAPLILDIYATFGSEDRIPGWRSWLPTLSTAVVRIIHRRKMLRRR